MRAYESILNSILYTFNEIETSRKWKFGNIKEIQSEGTL